MGVVGGVSSFAFFSNSRFQVKCLFHSFLHRCRARCFVCYSLIHTYVLSYTIITFTCEWFILIYIFKHIISIQFKYVNIKLTIILLLIRYNKYIQVMKFPPFTLKLFALYSFRNLKRFTFKNIKINHCLF